MTETEIIRQLWAKNQVEKRVLAFGHAIDSADWPVLRSCFGESVEIDFQCLTGFPPVRVEADLWARFSELALARFRCFHQYTNLNIAVTGEIADALIYVAARHWRQTERGSNQWMQYGWYELGLEQSGEKWLIRRIKQNIQWIDGNMGLLDFSEPNLAEVMAAIFDEKNAI